MNILVPPETQLSRTSMTHPSQTLVDHDYQKKRTGRNQLIPFLLSFEVLELTQDMPSLRLLFCFRGRYPFCRKPLYGNIRAFECIKADPTLSITGHGQIPDPLTAPSVSPLAYQLSRLCLEPQNIHPSHLNIRAYMPYYPKIYCTHTSLFHHGQVQYQGQGP